MAGEAQELRDFIHKSLRSQSKASLVEAIGYFDHKNHALPTIWRLNQALTELADRVTLSSDGLNLEISANADSVQLSENEMSRVVDAYMKAIRTRDPAPSRGA